MTAKDLTVEKLHDAFLKLWINTTLRGVTWEAVAKELGMPTEEVIAFRNADAQSPGPSKVLIKTPARGRTLHPHNKLLKDRMKEAARKLVLPTTKPDIDEVKRLIGAT